MIVNFIKDIYSHKKGDEATVSEVTGKYLIERRYCKEIVIKKEKKEYHGIPGTGIFSLN